MRPYDTSSPSHERAKAWLEETLMCWLARPNIGVLQPTNRHFEVLGGLAKRSKARGTLLMDAHVAALAVEHGAMLCSTDRAFARFKGLRLEDPLSI